MSLQLISLMSHPDRLIIKTDALCFMNTVILYREPALCMTLSSAVHCR